MENPQAKKLETLENNAYQNISPEDLHKALGFEKQHRNAILVKLRKLGCWHPQTDDERGFYAEIIRIIEDEDNRKHLKKILYDLATSGKLKAYKTYHLDKRISDRVSINHRSILYPDGLPKTIPISEIRKNLKKLDEQDEKTYSRVLHWLSRYNLSSVMLEDKDSNDNFNDTEFCENVTEIDQSTIQADCSIENPREEWEQALSDIKYLIENINEPDAETAILIGKMAKRAHEAAILWADSSRLEAIQEKLCMSLNELKKFNFPVLDTLRSALEASSFSSADFEMLSEWELKTRELFIELQSSHKRFEDARQALEATVAAQNYSILQELGPQTDSAKADYKIQHDELKEWLKKILGSLNNVDYKEKINMPNNLARDLLKNRPVINGASSETKIIDHASSEEVSISEKTNETNESKTIQSSTYKKKSKRKPTVEKTTHENLERKVALKKAISESLADTAKPDSSQTLKNDSLPTFTTVDANHEDEQDPLSAEDALKTYTSLKVDSDIGYETHDEATDVKKDYEDIHHDSSDKAKIFDESFITETFRDNAPDTPQKTQNTEPSLSKACLALWEAVGAGRPGLAWHIARSLPEAFSGPAAVFQALALGSCIGSYDDEVGLRLHQALTEVELAWDSDWGLTGLGRQLLIFAALPRATLLAPYVSRAPEMLDSLQLLDRLEGFRDLRHTLRESVALGGRLTPTLLRGAFPQAEWEVQVKSVREEAETWLNEAAQRSTSFHRATVVWRQWCAPTGILGQIMLLIKEAGTWPHAVLKEFLDETRDSTQIDRLIQSTDIRQTKESIEGGARKQLLTWVNEIRDLIRQCLDLLDARPSEQGRLRDVHRLRERLLSQIQQAKNALSELPPDNEQQSIGMAVEQSLQDLHALLDPQVVSRPNDAWEHLNGDLLFDPSVVFNEEWEPLTFPSPDQLTALAYEPRNWSQAVIARCEAGDLRGADRLLTLGTAQLDEETMAQLRERFLNQGDRQRRMARDRLEQLRTRLEMALLQGSINEERFAANIRRLDLFNDSETADLQRWRQEFNTMQAELDEGDLQLVKQLRNRLAEVQKDDIRARIEHCLEQGDLLTATEYLALHQAGETLAEAEAEEDAFGRFFPRRVKREFRPSTKVLKADVLEHHAIGTLSLDRLSEERLNSAAELIDLWRSMESNLATGVQGIANMSVRLKRFFEALDFRDVEVKTSGARNGTLRTARSSPTFDLICQPFAERSRCPVAYFGSQANGLYTVRCMTEEPVDVLINELRRTASTHPMLTLMFGWLDEEQRRKLAHQCHQYHLPVLVIDEALVHALCSESGDRARALFDWTLPFTALNPFVTTAGRVPPELFYGRHQALRAVQAPREGYLIYGGRQLGKTALLAMAEHLYHDPAHGHLAIRVDLKSESIGYGRGAHELWEVVARKLHQINKRILDERTLRNLERDATQTVFERLLGWLKDEPQRRLLLMLDEADAFLQIDAAEPAPFAVVAKLKQLMEETDHRFKVVFAGLHDVQRTARLARVPNSPIAHFGRGICIGPLLADNESREARRLLMRPLAALGYHFDSPELPGRILALTNYYPSLIQVFGSYLLDTFPARGNARSGPPYLITSQHVDDTFRQSALREEFVKRFAMTVELDPRYHLIALLIAYRELGQHSNGVIKPTEVDINWVRDNALAWWPQGFEDQQRFEDFRTLVEEMVGLGVLRVVPGEEGRVRYALRSPGIVHMLGGSERIEHSLQDIMGSQPPRFYEADIFHPHLGGEGWQRSPLTGRQEEALHELLSNPERRSMALLGGPLSSSAQELEELFKRYDRKPNRFQRFETLEQLLERLTKRADYVDGAHLCIIDSQTPWRPNWLTATAERLKKLKRRTIKLLFIGDAATAWHWVRAGEDVRDDMLQLLPWRSRAVKQWLHDINCPVSDEECQNILNFTGGWGQPLGYFAEQVTTSKRSVNINRALETATAKALTEPVEWPDPAIPRVLKHFLKYYPDGAAKPDEAVELLKLAEELPADDRSMVTDVMTWAELVGWIETIGIEHGRLIKANGLLNRLLNQV